jgi:hypothetical protein
MKREDFFDLCGQPPCPAHGGGGSFMLDLLFHPVDKSLNLSENLVTF